MEEVQEGWRELSLGTPPAPTNQHSNGGITGSTANHLLTPAVLRPVALADPLPSKTATLTPQVTAPNAGGPEIKNTKRTLPTDAGQGLRPTVSPRPEPDSSQPDNPEGRKQKGLRVGAQTGPPPPARWGAWAPTRVPPAFCATWDTPLSSSRPRSVCRPLTAFPSS